MKKTPSLAERTSLLIDIQLAGVWELLPAAGLDEQHLEPFAHAARLAYVRGYHDGDYSDPFKETWPDELGLDLRLVDVFIAVSGELTLDEADVSVLANVLRAGYTRGYLDGSEEETLKPFGRASRERPNSLRLGSDS